MSFIIVSAGWNCADWLTQTLRSVERQDLEDWQIWITYDPSDDDGAERIQEWCEERDDRWNYTINTERRFATRNHHDSITKLDPKDDDIIVFLDLDGDMLAHPQVLQRIRDAYLDGALVTFGQYRPIPDMGTSGPAQWYPPEVVANNSYRKYHHTGGAGFNHPRTMAGRVFRAIPVSSFQWQHSGAAMVPGTLERYTWTEGSWYEGSPLRTDQRVVTPVGWQEIGHLEAGDRVMGLDGKPTTVLGVYPQGVCDLYRVGFSDGTEVVCDDSHRWTVARSARNHWKTLPLHDIRNEGVRYTHKSGGHFRFRVPMAAALELPEVDLPVDPYLLGYMLGDGGFTNSSPRITAYGDDLPWVKALPQGIIPRDIETRQGFCPQYQLVKADSRVRWRPNPLTDALRELALWGCSGPDKFIPERYLWGSYEQRWALLQGLLDSDGEVAGPGGGRAHFNNTSLKLHEGIRQLAQSLGGLARLERKVRHNPGPPRTETQQRVVNSNARPCYRTAVQLDSDEPPFRLQYKRAKWRNRMYPLTRTIVSIEPTLDAEAVCIKVDADDGLFLTEGMVPTHNTDYLFMVPALELAGGRHHCFDEVLLLYNHDNPLADNKTHPQQAHICLQDFYVRPPLERLP